MDHASVAKNRSPLLPRPIHRPISEICQTPDDEDDELHTTNELATMKMEEQSNCKTSGGDKRLNSSSSSEDNTSTLCTNKNTRRASLELSITSSDTPQTSLDALAQICQLHIKNNPHEVVKFVLPSDKDLSILPHAELQLVPTCKRRALNIPMHIGNSSSSLARGDNGGRHAENDGLSVIVTSLTPGDDVESQHNSRKGVPKRRLSRSNSAKKNNGSFRGGSLKNVMEEVEADMDSVNPINHDNESPGGTRKKQTRRRGVSRNNSGRRRVTPLMNSEYDNTSHAPARRLSRGNSAKGGSFQGGSLKNVTEDKEADMDSVNIGDNDEKNAEVPGERRRSYPPSSARSDSFRTNSLRSIRLCNSTSSLSSCASSSLHHGSSLTIMDFRQNSRYSVGSSSDADRDSSSNNVSSMLDSTDLDCCWGDLSCRNMTGHPVLARMAMAMASVENRRSDSMGSSAFLNWVNQGGDAGTPLSTRKVCATTNDNKAKSKCQSDHSQVASTSPTAKPKHSRSLFKQIRRLSSGLTGGTPRRSWNESTEEDPHCRSTINASNMDDGGTTNIGKGIQNESRGDFAPSTLCRRSNVSASIDEIETEPPPNNNKRATRRRRFLDRLSKSLTSNFRRSSVDDNNDPDATKASIRRLRNSTGNMVASEDLNDDYLLTTW